MLRINVDFKKFEYYIFIIAILKVLNLCLYGLNHLEIFPVVRFCNEKFSNNYLIHEFWNYLSIFIISFILNLKELKALAPQTFERTERKTWVKLIYNDNKYNNNQDMSKKYLFLYFLTIFFWVFVEQIIENIYLKIFQDLDFWMLELMILSFLNKFVFYNTKIYKHQILAIILTIIPAILKIISIWISFRDNTIEKDNYTGNLPIYYIKNREYRIPIGIIIYILFICLRSCVNLILKWYMDFKYISHNQILTVYGGIGTIVYLIICITTTFIECKNIKIENKTIDHCNYLAKVIKNNDGKIYYYFDNFKIYFKALRDLNLKELSRELLIIFFGMIIFLSKNYCSLMVIHYLNPAYLIFSIPFGFMVQKVVSLIWSIPKRNRKYITRDNYKLKKFLLDTSGDIISFFAFLIYLGIMVLDFCNLDYDIVPNIMKRGCKEANASSEISESSDSFYDENDKDSNKLLDDSEDSIVNL